MNKELIWPDKREFGSKFGQPPADSRVRQIREVSSTVPGVIRRVVEFNHSFQTVAYVEPRNEKKGIY
ncbi:hypothetical protein [Undibacterium terreum]|uniref:Uncharacterized protein n=1 Tax=Undibacterium terreum TaxID=1224302 RepID=A0A916UWU7_9BURK|nr:hypothetical protein [Undibacterium terreum]GGC89051.1 hypothetical protein GCM10011396_40350 [Undibacterium terreum]